VITEPKLEPPQKLVTAEPKLEQPQKLVIREVLIKTVKNAGEGDDLAFPAKPDYNNPIHAIFKSKENYVYGFKFETKDGAVSVHPNSAHQFERKVISPKDAPITKIEVWYGYS
jgi:hypothetical protein